jgi:hypothetical protein
MLELRKYRPRYPKGVNEMAFVVIVPKTDGSIEDAVHLEYKEAKSMSITEIPDGPTLVTVIDRHGDEVVFEDPASYSYSEEDN